MERPIKHRTILVVSLALAAAVPHVFADGGVPLWTNLHSEVTVRNDRARAIVVDENGNVFVTGESSLSGIQSHYVTAAYSSSGSPLWTNRYSGPVSGQHMARAIAVDGSGNVFVTGYSASGTYYPDYDYATVKYSGTGVPLWTNRYEGWSNGGNDEAHALALDGSGNVFVTGSSVLSGSVPGSWYSDFATVACSGAGTRLWAARYTGLGGTNSANAIAVDDSGNVFVTGSSAPLGGANPDYATVGYSSTGGQLWARTYNGPGNGSDIARAVAVDAVGNVFVTGFSWNTGSGYDYATIKYSGAGVPLWIKRYNGTGNTNDFAVAIAVDGSGNVFTTGYSIRSDGVYDFATVAYSGDGTPLWTNRYAGPGNDGNRASAVAVDARGNVFVTGYSTSVIWPYSSYVTVAYSAAGVALWTNRYPTLGLTPAQATALAVDKSGSVIVTGYASLISGNAGYATIKYSAFVPLGYLDLQNLIDQLVLSWTNTAFSLQSAPTITGPFTNVSGATSPYTNPITGAQQFFRLISN